MITNFKWLFLHTICNAQNVEKHGMNTLRNRRTIRTYSDKTIENELLDELFALAARSSNTGNMQLYSVVVTRDSTIKQALAPAHFNQKQVTEAPVLLTFCADLNRTTAWCEQRKAKPGFDNLQALTYAAIDAIIFAQTFCVAAEGHGLGICYLGTTTYNAESIIDTLKLPELVIPVTTISIGYPADTNPAALNDRLPLEGIVHNETYHAFTHESIDRIYAFKEQLDESGNFVSINRKETLAQVYTDIRYKKADNEFFSQAWVQAIKRQGFLK
jgi:FMN reductase [NAD(P)H]